MKIVWPLGKLEAPGCSVTCSTCAVVGRGRRIHRLSTTYHTPVVAAASAKRQARRLKTRIRTKTTASATAPLASPIQVNHGNVKASGPQFVAWTSFSTVASTGRNGCITTMAVRNATARAAETATARAGRRNTATRRETAEQPAEPTEDRGTHHSSSTATTHSRSQ